MIRRQLLFFLSTLFILSGASQTAPAQAAAGFLQVSAGAQHSCAITTMGGIKCWGRNAEGQLGNNSPTSHTSPKDVADATSGFTAVAAGTDHTCALTAGGGVQCWGRNDMGQLGDSTTTDSPIPVNVTGLMTGVSATKAGNGYTCALTTGGSVHCWGKNNNGQLGDGTNVNKTAPVSVSLLASSVAEIDSGTNHSCAVTTAGGVYCWGYNIFGQLGDGTTTSSNVPVSAPSLATNFTSISAGGTHSCALAINGGVRCWGGNFFGQLGNGSTSGSTSPVIVSGLGSGVAAISADGFHNCVALTSGGAKCWGQNNAGQLGNGSSANALTPVNVSGLTAGVTAIVTGSSHSCALTSGGLMCWGANNTGQLGIGSTVASNVPAAVACVGITLSAISGSTTEGGGTATLTIVLDSQPSANVFVFLGSSDSSEATVTAVAAFTTSNWNVAQTMTVTGVDDSVFDGAIAYDVLITSILSSDTNYSSLASISVSTTNLDNDVAGISVGAASSNITTEAAGSATFSVQLDSQPTAPVTIPISSSDVTEGAVSPASLTFTAANWNTAQVVTVTGVDDATVDGNVAYVTQTGIAVSADTNYSGLNANDVALTNQDDDAAGITVTTFSTITTEAAGAITFTVQLDTQPSATVTIALSSSNLTEGAVSPATLLFTAANWNTSQVVTVTGVDDASVDGNVAYMVQTGAAVSTDANYSGLNANDVSLINNDDDTTTSTCPCLIYLPILTR